MFPVILFVMLYKVVLICESGWNIRVKIQMKVTLQYYPVVLFIMLFKVLPFFDSMDKVLL